MIPPLIVERALALGIDIIAITDHNSTANIPSVQKAAEGFPLVVLPGMELQTREEIHSLCLFDTFEQANQLQKIVESTFARIKNRPDFFGEQFVVDETGEFIRREDQLLLTSSSLSLNEASKIVIDLGGLFIPAHVNRKAFGLLANLGFIPIDIKIEALEISKHLDIKTAKSTIPQLSNYPLILNGDVHRLSDFYGEMTFHIKKPSILEIRLALSNSQERFVSFASSSNEKIV